jgi:surface antigen
MKFFLRFIKFAAFLVCIWLISPGILGKDEAEGPPETGGIVGAEKVENTPEGTPKAGDILTTYRTIPVYSNGDNYTLSYGRHFSENQYYYGQKWQCVEFVKRFYHDAFNHQMPSSWGHARSYYDPTVIHGQLNKDRGMFQFKNGGATCPQPDDLLVFDFAPYGHVSVISSVRENEIEVVQQNIKGRPRQTYHLEKKDGLFTVLSKKKPVGWLRLPAAKLRNPVFPVDANLEMETAPAP